MLIILHKNIVTKQALIRQLSTSRVEYTNDCAEFPRFMKKMNKICFMYTKIRKIFIQ